MISSHVIPLPNRVRSRRLLAFGIALTAALAVACGGGSDRAAAGTEAGVSSSDATATIAAAATDAGAEQDPVASDELVAYFDQIQTLFREYNAVWDELDDARTANEDLVVWFSDLFAGRAPLQRDFLTRFDEIRPPSEVAVIHADILTTGSALELASDDLAASLGAIGTLQELQALQEDLEVGADGYGLLLRDFNVACFPLRGVAGTHEIPLDVPFRCPTIPRFDPDAPLVAQPEPLPPIDHDPFLAADVDETAFGDAVIRDSSVPDFAPIDWRTDWGVRTVEFFEISPGVHRVTAFPRWTRRISWTWPRRMRSTRTTRP